jgi:hypothetical protein
MAATCTDAVCEARKEQGLLQALSGQVPPPPTTTTIIIIIIIIAKSDP